MVRQRGGGGAVRSVRGEVRSVLTTLRSARVWLAGAVISTAAIAWIGVAVAASSQRDFANELSVAGIALTIGGLEATFLAWRAWARMQKVIAVVVAALASCGAIIVFVATSPGLTTGALVLVAMGVAMVGFACAVGLYGVLTGPDSSTPALVTALALVGALAYLAQVLWGASRP